MTTTILPEHPVCSANGEYETPLFAEHFPVAGAVPLTHTPGTAQIYGYIRTSRQVQEGAPGMDPASQELQLQRAGVPRYNIYRDVGVSSSTGTQQHQGWHRLNGRLAGATPW